MSLAASVLSMSSRFKDLGIVLYDFVGVSILSGVIEFFVLLILALKDLVREVAAQYWKGSDLKLEGNGVAVLTGCSVVTWGAVLLASFLVGVFKDVQLSGLIIGHAVAATVSLVLVALKS